ncbi:MFS transporter [Rickettsia endosymbiont of Ixodes scapularis]|uniref:MFS transporter n=1 Tax=Rickettsia endosymbiont of Ixodes scapularis TaxID=444612 RepID=UPI0035283F7E
MPISNWLGDKFGLKNIYILSIILFGVASCLCASINNFYVLILLRFLLVIFCIRE